MKRTIVLLAAVAALATAACRHETKSSGQTATTSTTTTAAARGTNGYATGNESQPAPKTAEAAEGTDVGQKMPAYEAKTLEGETFNLASEKGNVVFLNLWATWCGPCRYEIPELEKLHAQHANDGFKVIGVSLDETGPDAVKEFIKTQKMSYPVIIDAEGKLANLFQTTVIPTSVVIDREGKIVWKRFGAVEPNDPTLAQAITKALAEKRS